MKARFLTSAVAGAVAVLLLAGCGCGDNSVCGEGATVIGPTTIVTSQQASPTPTPADSCAIDYMLLSPLEGGVVPVGSDIKLDLTPYQTVVLNGVVQAREVPKACNLPRASSIQWDYPRAFLSQVAAGFNPVYHRAAPGAASVTATLEGHVSNTIVLR